MTAYNLVYVGAHDGSRTDKYVDQVPKDGNVILIEPVPWLYKKLASRYRASQNVKCLRCAITPNQSENIVFYAPTQKSTQVINWASELGSLDPSHAKYHATRHNLKWGDWVEEIQVPSLTFSDLVEKFDISHLVALITDVEGYDSRILPTFPFGKVKPRQIKFEFKHSDGPFSLGENFITALRKLISEGYSVRPFDGENCIATHHAIDA